MILAVLIGAAVVVVVRLWMRRNPERHTPADYPGFTAGLAAVGAAVALGDPWFGDQLIDGVARKWLGENISDLARSLYTVAACALLGAFAIHGLADYLSENVKWDVRGIWIGACGAVELVLIAASRFGDARTVPVPDELALSDAWSGIYCGVLFLTMAATCVVLAAWAVIGARERGVRGMVASVAVAGALGAVTATASLVLLIFHRAWLIENYPAVSTAWAVPIASALIVAGAFGFADRHG